MVKTILIKDKVSSSHQSLDITVLSFQHAMTTVHFKFPQSVMLDVLLIYEPMVTQIITTHVCWAELRIRVPIVPKKNYFWIHHSNITSIFIITKVVVKIGPSLVSFITDLIQMKI